MGEIVVGYDGTDGGKAALDEALRLAEDLDDRVVVVFGFAPPGVWGGEIAEHEEAIVEFGENLMAEAEERTKGSGVEHETALIPKKAVEALIEVAERRRARMIVVGAYGESPFKGAIVGSTPYKLMHLSRHPVLVVPAKG